MPLHTSSLVFLVGGGRSPRYPPNKVIFWDDAQGKEAAELEFRERVRGLACRRGWLAVALRRRVVVFRLDTSIERYDEWDTCDNTRGKYTRYISRILSAGSYTHGCPRLHRFTSPSHRHTFHTNGDTRPTDRPCTTSSPTPMPSISTYRASVIITTTPSPASIYQASSDNHSCSHVCPNNTLRSSLWTISGYHLCPRNTDSYMGLYVREANARAEKRIRQG